MGIRAGDGAAADQPEAEPGVEAGGMACVSASPAKGTAVSRRGVPHVPHVLAESAFAVSQTGQCMAFHINAGTASEGPRDPFSTITGEIKTLFPFDS